MNGLVCNVCGFISINGIAPENCPVCHAPKTSFEEKQNAIRLPVDMNNLTDLEKKHIPVITVVKKCGLIPEGCYDVHVNIGQIQHPMQAGGPLHYIVHIDFYINQEFISMVKLTPGNLNPIAALNLKSSAIGKFSVIAYCNLHGAWIKEQDL